MIDWIYKRLSKWSWFRRLEETSKKVSLPGFEGLPIYHVTSFFVREMKKESVLDKGAALTFHFFLALFPAIIFLFTLMPYLPIQNFHDQTLILLSDLLPTNAYQAIESTIEDILEVERGGLLSIGFIMALFFSTNGIHNLMTAFNRSSLIPENRPFFKQRFIALFLTISLVVLLILGIGLVVGGEYTIKWLKREQIIEGTWMATGLQFIRWGVIVLVFFLSISLLYYFGPATKKKFRFISAGSSLATFLIILTSLAFSYYINHFGQYNKLYGSVGTLLVVMIWIYINSIVLLIGFELNASISLTRKRLLDEFN